MSELVIAYRHIEDLQPYARNARTHSEEQVEQIAKSITEFGWTNPVLVDESGGIIAGHGRVLAASRLGLVEVPTICVAGLSEAQRRALVIADNSLGLNAGWDAQLLTSELQSLQAVDFNLDLLGFSDLASLLLDKVSGENDPAEEWRGMPEFDQRDKTAFRSLQVHFQSQEAVDRFAELIMQKITSNTRFVWYPRIEIETYADKRYS